MELEEGASHELDEAEKVADDKMQQVARVPIHTIHTATILVLTYSFIILFSRLIGFWVVD